jgi:membrane-associated protein
LFTLAPIAAIVGGEVGYWFGKKFGRPFFDRPESRFFNQKMVQKVEKYLATYGPRKALVFGRFIPFVRTLINPTCGIANLDRKLFSTWNAIGAVIWTQSAMGIGYFLGDVFKENGNYFMVGIVTLIVVGTSIPLALEIFKERQSKRYRPKSDN